MLKKGLSQHLLKDKNLLKKMVRLSGVGPEDTVLEIGPGQGDLTRQVAGAAGPVYAVELDKGFSTFLEPLEREFPNVRVIFSDILRVRLEDFSRGRRITVMGNIPYKITGDILFKLLMEKAAVRGAYLTMQKEVAERLTSRTHARSYGALSVIFQLYAEVKMLLTLKPALFIPPPKVESAYISIVFRSGPEVDEGLVTFIKACFRYKRKYLRHSLEKGYDTRHIDALYTAMSFPPSIRAEEIEPEGFRGMYEFLRQVQ